VAIEFLRQIVVNGRDSTLLRVPSKWLHSPDNLDSVAAALNRCEAFTVVESSTGIDSLGFGVGAVEHTEDVAGMPPYRRRRCRQRVAFALHAYIEFDRRDI